MTKTSIRYAKEKDKEKREYTQNYHAKLSASILCRKSELVKEILKYILIMSKYLSHQNQILSI